jgi:hypothetical protein
MLSGETFLISLLDFIAQKPTDCFDFERENKTNFFHSSCCLTSQSQR